MNTLLKLKLLTLEYYNCYISKPRKIFGLNRVEMENKGTNGVFKQCAIIMAVFKNRALMFCLLILMFFC